MSTEYRANFHEGKASPEIIEEARKQLSEKLSLPFIRVTTINDSMLDDTKLHGTDSNRMPSDELISKVHRKLELQYAIDNGLDDESVHSDDMMTELVSLNEELRGANLELMSFWRNDTDKYKNDNPDKGVDETYGQLAHFPGSYIAGYKMSNTRDGSYGKWFLEKTYKPKDFENE